MRASEKFLACACAIGSKCVESTQNASYVSGFFMLPENRVSNLIYYLGGRSRFQQVAAAKQFTISLSTIGSWITRNSLPARYMPLCNAVADSIGKPPINWLKFFEEKSLTDD